MSQHGASKSVLLGLVASSAFIAPAAAQSAGAQTTVTVAAQTAFTGQSAG
jgi:hypothetical protein